MSHESDERESQPDHANHARTEGKWPPAGFDYAAHYRHAVECSTVATMCVSARAGCYVFVNQAFADLVGYPKDELLTRDPYEIWAATTDPDDMREEQQAIAAIAKGQIDSFQYERRFITRQGKIRWVRGNLAPTRDEQGRLEFMTVYVADIDDHRAAASTREQLETQLRQEQKLGAVGKLAGGIAHDFNNRLLIIMGHAELLKAELPAGNGLVQHLDTVLASAKGGAALTRQLLAYSRRQVLKPEPFDLNELTDRMRRVLSSVVGDHIQIRAALDTTAQVVADPGQIEQVILNLALNARDAMPGGGSLALETRQVVIGPAGEPGLAAGNYVALSVTDTGTGIPADVLPHIFEPFFTTKEIGRGTGLGLAMVEGIVQQSGGATRVKSRVGEGTTLTVLLPEAGAFASPASAVDGRSLEEPPRKGGFETVLVCDDDAQVRELLVAVLSLRGYRILQARNGRHALEVARDHGSPIHLLISDLEMPELGGGDLGDELRRRDPGLRILYISGYSPSGHSAIAASLGSNTHFLVKPFLPADLTRTVSSILEGRAE